MSYLSMEEWPITLGKLLAQAVDKNEQHIEEIKNILADLEVLPVTKKLLEKTRLGKSVNESRKKIKDAVVKKRAKSLVDKWRHDFVTVNKSDPPLDSPITPLQSRGIESMDMTSPHFLFECDEENEMDCSQPNGEKGGVDQTVIQPSDVFDYQNSIRDEDLVFTESELSEFDLSGVKALEQKDMKPTQLKEVIEKLKLNPGCSCMDCQEDLYDNHNSIMSVKTRCVICYTTIATSDSDANQSLSKTKEDGNEIIEDDPLELDTFFDVFDRTILHSNQNFRLVLDHLPLCDSCASAYYEAHSVFKKIQELENSLGFMTAKLTEKVSRSLETHFCKKLNGLTYPTDLLGQIHAVRLAICDGKENNGKYNKNKDPKDTDAFFNSDKGNAIRLEQKEKIGDKNNAMRLVLVQHEEHSEDNSDHLVNSNRNSDQVNCHKEDGISAPSKVKKFDCWRCGEEFDMNIERRVHMKVKHNGDESYRCRYCFKICRKRYSLKVHEKAHEKNNDVIKMETKSFKKKKHASQKSKNNCGKVFVVNKKSSNLIYSEEGKIVPKEREAKVVNSIQTASTLILVQHEEKLKEKSDDPVTTIQKPVQVDCDKEDEISAPLNDKKFICRKCGEEFTLNVERYDHMKSKHVGDELLHCRFCPKTFKFLSYLQRHEGVHERLKSQENSNKDDFSKRYVCGVCGKRLSSKSGLKTHRKIHMPKRFTCAVCKKEFIFKKELRRHEETHKPYSQRSFKCGICDRRFSSSACARKHERRHASDDTETKTVWCKTCGKYFFKMDSLKKHKCSQKLELCNQKISSN